MILSFNRRTKLFIFFIFVVVITPSFCLFQKKEQKKSYIIKVAILTNQYKFKLSCLEYNYPLLIKTSSGKVYTVKLKKPVIVRVLPLNKVRIGTTTYVLPVKLYSSGKICIDKNLYSGEFEIIPSSNGVNVINYLNLEQYLYGVIPYEIEPSWSDEMLKIQAVVARTYTLANLARHKNNGFDFCSTVHCQVYRGVPKDKNFYSRVKKIIDSTTGLVVVDKKGNLVNTYYHATCGGHTENISEIWNISQCSYLHGVKCDYCKTAPYYNWSYSVPQQKFTTLFYSAEKKKKNVKVENIRPVKQTSTGRSLLFSIQWSDGTTNTVSFDKLQEKLGYTKLKSGKVDNIVINETEITFYGRGWGHGVGLCQWGANTLTLQGKKFDQVIKYYYPKTKIKKLN